MAFEDKLIGPALKFNTFLDKFPKVYNVYVIAMISCISGMMFGIDISSMSVFVSDKDYLRFFNSPNSELQGFITSSMALGSFFGAISASFVSEPFGRRPSLMTCGFFWVVGAVIQSSAQNVAQLIIGRIRWIRRWIWVISCPCLWFRNVTKKNSWLDRGTFSVLRNTRYSYYVFCVLRLSIYKWCWILQNSLGCANGSWTFDHNWNFFYSRIP